MPGSFLPSRHGLGFDNSWPPAPAVVVPTPFGEIKLGAANGGRQHGQQTLRRCSPGERARAFDRTS